MNKRAFTTTLLISTLVFATTARAQQDKNDETARIHFKAGTSYYETGDYELALREFNRSYELSGRPELQYNISLTYEKLGDIEAATQALDNYLNEAKDIPNRKTLELRLTNLNKRLAQQKEEVAAEQAAAAAASEAQPTSDVIDSSGQAEQAPEPIQSAPPSEPVYEQQQKSAKTESTAVEPEHEDEKILGLPTEVFVSYAAAGAGALTFIIFGSLAAAEDASLSDECLNNAEQGICSESDVSSLDTFATVADIGLAFALIGGAVGTVLLLTSDDKSEQTSEISVAPYIGINRTGAAAGVRF